MRAAAHPAAAPCRRVPAPAGGGAIVGGRPGPAARASCAADGKAPRRPASSAQRPGGRPRRRRRGRGPAALRAARPGRAFPAFPGFHSTRRPALASSLPSAMLAIMSPSSRMSIVSASLHVRGRAAAFFAGPGAHSPRACRGPLALPVPADDAKQSPCLAVPALPAAAFTNRPRIRPISTLAQGRQGGARRRGGRRLRRRARDGGGGRPRAACRRPRRRPLAPCIRPSPVCTAAAPGPPPAAAPSRL